MKKLFLSALAASLMIVPFGTVAMAEQQEAAIETVVIEEYVPGSVPAESTLADSMTPTVHALLLAMENQNATQFDANDSALAFEALYNILSMYGQMDERSECMDGMLIIPSETVSDFSTALLGRCAEPEELPSSLTDRMVYNGESDCYELVCGTDSLSQVCFTDCTDNGSVRTLSGSLIYQIDQSELLTFRVTSQYADNMFGYIITELNVL